MVTTSEFWVKRAKNTIRKYIYFFWKNFQFTFTFTFTFLVLQKRSIFDSAPSLQYARSFTYRRG